MQKLVNFLRGSVRLSVTGPFPERFLNLCAQNGVGFWDLERHSGERIELTVARRDRKKARALGEKLRYGVEEGNGYGIPSFLLRFRKRYALLVGLALSLAAVCVLSQFILTVEISGNSGVSSAEIATALRLAGVKPGAYGPGIDPAMAGQEVLRRVKELSWCAVNLKGTVAQVLVREAVEPPKLLDEKTLGDIVADAPGIVTHMEVLEGEPAVEEGATVAEGDVLITGNVHMEGAEYSGIDLGWRQVKAQGRIYARTWRTIEAQIPLEAEVKRYTGEEKTLWSLHLLGGRINFYANSGFPFPMYDKISTSYVAQLPGGQEMPLSLNRETARAYETQAVPIHAENARVMLERALEKALSEAVGEGEVIHAAFSAREADGKLVVTLRAECREEIGKFKEYEDAP